MDDDIIDSLRYAIQATRDKGLRNHYYGRSAVETISQQNGSVIQFGRSTKKSRLKAKTSEFVIAPLGYDSPWESRKYRKWAGRAEQFWDARLQPELVWEWEKNGDKR